MIKRDPMSPYRVDYDDDGKKIVQCDLIADTRDEVISNGTSCTNIDGLPDDATLIFGSSAFTMKEKTLLTLDSSGSWN